MATPTADYQASLLGLLMGATTPYHFGAAGISGFGHRAKTTDIALDLQEGIASGPDFRDARTIIFHIEIVEATAAAAFDAFADLRVAWLPVAANVPLHIQLPGLGHVVFNGRPRDFEEDMTDFVFGHISVIATFVALDPQAVAP